MRYGIFIARQLQSVFWGGRSTPIPRPWHMSEMPKKNFFWGPQQLKNRRGDARSYFNTADAAANLVGLFEASPTTRVALRLHLSNLLIRSINPRKADLTVAFVAEGFAQQIMSKD